MKANFDFVKNGNDPSIILEFIMLGKTLQCSKVIGNIAELIGFSSEDLRSGEPSFESLIHPDDTDISQAIFSHTNQINPIDLTLRISKKDNQIRIVRALYTKSHKAKDQQTQIEIKLESPQDVDPLFVEKSAFINFIALLENTNDFIYFKDRNHRFNGASKTLVGITEPSSIWKDLIGKTDYEMFPRELADTYFHLEKQIFTGEIAVAKETQPFVDKNGNQGWVDNRKYPVHDNEGNIIGLFGVAKDITEQKKTEDNLLTHREIITNMEEGVSLVRVSDQTMVFTNPTFEKMFGYPPGELLGQHVSILHAPGEISPKEAALNLITDLKAKGVWRGDVHTTKKDGTLFWSSLTTSAFQDPVYGEVWVSILSDITERKSLYEKLDYQAKHDSLTGLLSRYEFEKRSTLLISSISETQDEHAICFLDLDQFKIINDTCGHLAGDELLRQLARLLDNIVRKQDTLARLGGDEFGVLMEYCSLEQASRTANQILEAVRKFQFLWNDKTFRIGVSIGLVAITKSIGNFSDLLREADAACYLAKDKGRNRIHTYHPDDYELALRHGEMQWVSQITQALDEDRFLLYGQPIISFDNDNDRHYEILVRMIDNAGQIIPPGAFIPAAERYYLMEKLDAWVITNTLAFLANQTAFTDKIKFVSINLSGQSLTSENTLNHIIGFFKKAGISPNKVCFEVTETAAISHMESAIEFINRLKSIGCQFALDDFGSGISSFGYLKSLPVDYLKIYGMFVKDILSDPIDCAMVKSINDIGQVMGIKTIAEFVENDEIKMKLKSLGINYGQGYGLGEPEPLDNFIS